MGAKGTAVSSCAQLHLFSDCCQGGCPQALLQTPALRFCSSQVSLFASILIKTISSCPVIQEIELQEICKLFGFFSFVLIHTSFFWHLLKS